MLEIGSALGFLVSFLLTAISAACVMFVCVFVTTKTTTNLWNNWNSVFSVLSARSKVRGTLDIYHAYIRDTDNNSSRGDGDWEIVDNNSTTVSVSSVAVYLILRFPLREILTQTQTVFLLACLSFRFDLSVFSDHEFVGGDRAAAFRLGRTSRRQRTNLLRESRRKNNAMGTTVDVSS